MMFLVGSIAMASTFARVPELAELAERSSAVVTGEVTATTVSGTPHGLSTRYVVAVDRTLAGPAVDEVQVDLPGGSLGGLTQRFAGVPVWSEGERVLVFVPKDGDPQPLSGLFSLAGEDVVDPIARPGGPRSVADVAGRIVSGIGESDADPPMVRYYEAGGTSDP
jgi:hypothetical protein